MIPAPDHLIIRIYSEHFGLPAKVFVYEVIDWIVLPGGGELRGLRH
jgi:hypothetical protein